MSMCISTAQARTRWASRFGLAQPSRDFLLVGSLSLRHGVNFDIWFSYSTIDPGKEIFWVLWKVLLWRSCKRFRVQTQRWLKHQDLDQGLVEVPVRWCCEDPDEILPEVLAWTWTGPYEKILWRCCWHGLRGPCTILHRSLWEDLVEILVKSSLRGPCVKILHEDLTDAMYCIR